ncbi:hypothetical protein RB200_36810 [Streptomyces sp. PmtG]
MSVTLTEKDKNTLRIAAYGAVHLVTIAASTGSRPGRTAGEGSLALYSATGLVGHVLTEYPKDLDHSGASVAEVADRVLPSLTTAMSLLKELDAAEADNFRSTVLVAIETATRSHKKAPSPVLADITRKITEALDAA